MALVVTHTHPPISLYLSLSLSILPPLCCVAYSMATLQSLASTPHLHPIPPPYNNTAFSSARFHRSAFSTFHGHSLSLSAGKCQTLRRRRWNPIVMVQPKIQFIQGTDEQTVPDVRLTKSRDGTNGMAIFKFEQPSVFDSSAEVGDITGFYMIDEEGVIQSVDVNAKFINGKPAGIEAKYVMRTPREWDRFMRFMERYSNANGLQFVKK